MKAIATMLLALVFVSTASAEVYVSTYEYGEEMPTVEQGIADSRAPRTSQVWLDDVGGPYCRNLIVISDEGGIWGGYDLRVQAYGCSNGAWFTHCYTNHWVQSVTPPWSWDGWLNSDTYGGTGSWHCGRYAQAHVHMTMPFYFDTHRYPWMRGVLYLNGYDADSG